MVSPEYIYKPPAEYGNMSNNMQEVIRIAHDGNVYWRGRLVESDDEFKRAMLDLAECFKTR